MKKVYSFLLLTLSLSACSPPVHKAPEPYGVLPTEGQLHWHEMEMYCLIHYTPTTFQNKEWGYGDAEPALFNPSNFDANQIASAAAAAGFKGLISVAKHHDGFCLWPTATTDYSIASSPWREGKGDMVKEFMEASHNNGLEFGVYLSAWDRNDTRYGTPEYADAYREQLKELMTSYGTLFTSWHDGANGGDGYYGGRNEKRTIDRSTYYEWHEKTWPIIREYQPMAVIFSDIGPDVRWVGNEQGFANETSWATFTPEGIDGLDPAPGLMQADKLPEGTRNGEFWIPAECDVPHRPGWFYHPEQDHQVKTPDQLFEIYLKSVGRGANMNLGLAPMPEGVLHANDVKSLKDFGEKVKQTFAKNIAKNATIKASNTRGNNKEYGTQKLLDNDRYSYWATDDGVHQAELEVMLSSNEEFDLIRLRENIKLGQRIDSVNIEVWTNNNWYPLAHATSIGANRIIKLDKPISAEKLKLHIYAPVSPTLSDFALFKEAHISDNSLSLRMKGQQIDPSNIEIVDPREYSNGIEIILNNPDKTTWVDLKRDQISLTFMLKNQDKLTGFGYLPRQDGKKEGIPTKYRIETSRDGANWKTITSGEFSNIRSNPTLQFIPLSDSESIKYLRFTPEEIIGNNDQFSVAEIILFK